MGKVVILFNGAEPFENIFNTSSTKSPIRNLVEIISVVSKKRFKDYMILYMYTV